RERIEQPAADLDALDAALRLRRVVGADFVVLHALIFRRRNPAWYPTPFAASVHRFTRIRQ
ncbi:hypothetical protein, partial [Burkholderia multivorans]|uniref:hypothetical protein n=1 Tax=Burkholderia multivorans TaxID=87883 RepID=UPI0021AB9EA8